MPRAIDFLKSYFSYRLRSVNRHGVHSPFVFGLIEEVLRGSDSSLRSAEIETARRRLRHSDLTIRFQEMGGGKHGHTEKSIKDIARKSLSTPGQCAILARLAQYSDAQTILEVGTSLGVSTSYLASNGADVHTIEGNASVLETAQEVWAEVGVKDHIHPYIGSFSERLPEVLSSMGQVDMAFIDGDHRHQSTVDHFKLILPYCHDRTVFIFDDIHWSKGMEAAWAEISSHPRVRVTVDCFWMGMVFIDPGLSREDFTIRY